MQPFLDRFGHLLTTLLVAIVAIGAWKLGAPGEITAPLGLLLGGLVVQDGRNKPPPSAGTGTAAMGAVGLLMLLLVAGCASFGKFSPGASDDVKQACTVLDSGNPVIGVICLTAEEVTSIFSHVRAARASRQKRLGDTKGPVDVCEGAP